MASQVVLTSSLVVVILVALSSHIYADSPSGPNTEEYIVTVVVRQQKCVMVEECYQDHWDWGRWKCDKKGESCALVDVSEARTARRCKFGWTGESCSIAVCDPPCLDGRVCKRPPRSCECLQESCLNNGGTLTASVTNTAAVTGFNCNSTESTVTIHQHTESVLWSSAWFPWIILGTVGLLLLMYFVIHVTVCICRRQRQSKCDTTAGARSVATNHDEVAISDVHSIELESRIRIQADELELPDTLLSNPTETDAQYAAFGQYEQIPSGEDVNNVSTISYSRGPLDDPPPTLEVKSITTKSRRSDLTDDDVVDQPYQAFDPRTLVVAPAPSVYARLTGLRPHHVQ